MYQASKRVIDIVLSVLTLAVAAPVLLIVALIVRMDSPGPILFRQERLGKERRPFTMLKFRTMQHEADDSFHREAIRRAANGIRTSLADGTKVFKSPEDPRITHAGKFLRASCLDEIPQLINVLRGEMSLVGPRPALEYELEHYSDWYYRRFNARPGLTGSWQVQRSKAKDFDDMMRMDVKYADSTSTWTDLKLMAQTIPAIVRERGVF